MRAHIDGRVARDHPGLELVAIVLDGLVVSRQRDDLEEHKRRLEERVRS